MNIQLPTQMDKPAFLAWLDRVEERYELVGGRVVMMVHASRAHGMIIMNLATLLRDQLDPRQWLVLSEFGLDAGPKTLRFPDVVVDRAGGAPGDFTASAPVLAAEVLSPSTAAIDLGDKAAEYLRLPTLAAYLVFAQDEVKAWAYVRGNGGFPPGPEPIAGADEVIRIPPLGLSLPLAAIYAGLDLGAA
jgi:Uma2 family endonuclease